ncbi:MAG: flagellar biosynthesis protein FlhB [Proteobacteria bacterium]|nr:flagellar biosynthesis protein FlhB [Pseudomonadota bacterium]
MAEEDDAQKTEDPSDKKLSRARDKGQVAQSQEVKSWAVLLAGTFGIVFMAAFMAAQIRASGTRFIEMPHAMSADFESLLALLTGAVVDAMLASAPLFALLVVFALASNVVQVGFLLAPDKIMPDLSKLSLVSGSKRMLSSKAVVEFLKGIAKLVLVAAVAFGVTLPLLGDIELVPGVPIDETIRRIYEISIRLAASAVAVMTAIAGLDFAYQKFSFTKDMRMSKQEVKDEHKQSEGDPQVKAKIRALRQQRARQRMMSRVPEADVVITNPTHYAVALQYKMDEMSAPVLVAKGMDHIAFKIREVAEENDIPIVENAPLARALYASVDLEDQIPTEHFIAVAEVIGYVMRLKGKLPH